MRRKRDAESEAETNERQHKNAARTKLKRESEAHVQTEQRRKMDYERTTLNRK